MLPTASCSAPAAFSFASWVSRGRLEILAAGEGCRLGVSKAARKSRKMWPALCRANLLSRFCVLLEAIAAALDFNSADAGHEDETGAGHDAESTGDRQHVLQQLLDALSASGRNGQVVDVRPPSGPCTSPPLGSAAPPPSATLSQLRRLRYNDLKRVCGTVSGYWSAWQGLRQAPSPFERWIAKPEQLGDLSNVD